MLIRALAFQWQSNSNIFSPYGPAAAFAMEMIEGLNVRNGPKSNKVLNVITFCPKCDKVLNVINS